MERKDLFETDTFTYCPRRKHLKEVRWRRKERMEGEGRWGGLLYEFWAKCRRAGVFVKFNLSKKLQNGGGLHKFRLIFQNSVELQNTIFKFLCFGVKIWRNWNLNFYSGSCCSTRKVGLNLVLYKKRGRWKNSNVWAKIQALYIIHVLSRTSQATVFHVEFQFLPMQPSFIFLKRTCQALKALERWYK